MNGSVVCPWCHQTLAFVFPGNRNRARCPHCDADFPRPYGVPVVTPFAVPPSSAGAQASETSAGEYYQNPPKMPYGAYESPKPSYDYGQQTSPPPFDFSAVSRGSRRAASDLHNRWNRLGNDHKTPEMVIAYVVVALMFAPVLLFLVFSVFGSFLTAATGDAKEAGISVVALPITTIMGAIFTAVYAIPTAIAIARKHNQVASIAVVNLLLGWTLVGYAVALSWAVSDVKR